MSSALGEPWDELLEPINPESPCGLDLQYGETYDFIRRARQASTDQLPAGLWEREGKKTDFSAIEERCIHFLKHESKDLQVAAWLVEAMVFQDNLAGVSSALKYFYQVAFTFWTDVHPQVESDDHELRLKPINWLIIHSIEWFSPNGKLAQNDASGNTSSRIYWETILSIFSDLSGFLLNKYQSDSPDFEDAISCLKSRIYSSVDLSNPVSTSEAVYPDVSSINRRENAYDQLQEIAALLARLEPHSPVPMVLNALVSWRGKTFEDLLTKLPSQGGPTVYDLLKIFRKDLG